MEKILKILRKMEQINDDLINENNINFSDRIHVKYHGFLRIIILHNNNNTSK